MTTFIVEMQQREHEIRQRIRINTMIVMGLDVISLFIALVWTVLISFAWTMQLETVGTFMMQFLYLPYVLVIHSFFNMMRDYYGKVMRKEPIDALVLIQNALFYIGTGIAILGTMISVTVLRFISRKIESDLLYYSAVSLSCFISFVSMIQATWIIYTIWSFYNGWSDVKLLRNVKSAGGMTWTIPSLPSKA